MKSLATAQPMDGFVSDLMERMTLDEKIGQLTLVTSNLPVYPDVIEKVSHGSVGGLFGGLVDNSFAISGTERLREIQKLAVEKSPNNIPLLFGYDVIHGHETVFPIPLASSCAWNLKHTETIARIGALEAIANGINLVFSPMVDMGVDPRWGRIAEGSGEDPYLGSRIAETMVHGYQGDDLSRPDTVMACVKHFIGYSAAASGRDYNSADMSLHTLYSLFYPPFLAAAKAGVGSMMTSFSTLNAIPSHADGVQIKRYRKHGFKGLVISDYNAIDEMIRHGIGDENGQRAIDPLQTMSVQALKAGVQMDMMSWGYLRTLHKSVTEGKINKHEIDAACRAVLEAKYKLGLFEDPYRYLNPETSVRNRLTPAFRQAAREIAGDSCVLLKNEGQLLPLPKSGITLAVIGPLADDKRNLLGPWSFGGNGDKAVSVLEGIRNVVGDSIEVVHAKGTNTVNTTELAGYVNFAGTKVELDQRSEAVMLAEALSAAEKADIILAVLGEAAEMTGEAASSVTIEIPSHQRALLEALTKTGKPIVLTLMNGRPLVLSWEHEHIPAILETWFGGIEAGNAIADILFGDRTPSGKLTTTYPRHVGQLPLRYNHLNTGRPSSKIGADKYTTNCYINCKPDPLYPFGFGLSYTTFEYGKITANKTSLNGNDILEVSIAVKNTGSRAGDEIVQLYITDPVASLSRPVKELKDFQRLSFEAGEERIVTFSVTPEKLKFYNAKLRHVWEPGEFVIGIGRHSQDLQTLSVQWSKPPVAPISRHKVVRAPKLAHGDD